MKVMTAKKLTLVFLVCSTTFSNGHNNPLIKVVPGAYLKQEKKAIVYETSIPIMFQIQLPDKFFKEVSKNCLNELDCEIWDEEREIMRQMRQRIMEFNWSEENIRDKRQALFLAAGAGFLMRPIIGRIFPSLFGSESQIAEHVNKIQDALGAEHADLISFKSSVYKYTQKLAESLQEYRDDIDELIHMQSGINGIIGKLIILSHIRAEVTEFYHNIDLCQQKFLPTSLVSPELLKEKLTKLKTKLDKYNLKLAVSESQLHEYLQLPITDCFFTSDNAYISINIPISKKQSEWKLYSIQYTKFAYHNQVCDLYPQDAVYLASTNEKSIIIDKNLKKHCNLQNNQILCFVPPYTHDSSEFLHCALSMLHGKTVSELHAICTFRCSTAHGIISSQIDDDTVIVTNVENVTYQCGSNIKTFLFKKVGAIELTLMCDCTIFADDEIISPIFPCSLKSELASTKPFQLFPNTWTNLVGAISHQTDLFFSNDVGLVNHNWTSVMPVLNLTNLTFHLPSHLEVGYTYVDFWLWGLTIGFATLFLATCLSIRMAVAPRV